MEYDGSAYSVFLMDYLIPFLGFCCSMACLAIAYFCMSDAARRWNRVEKALPAVLTNEFQSTQTIHQKVNWGAPIKLVDEILNKMYAESGQLEFNALPDKHGSGNFPWSTEWRRKAATNSPMYLVN